MPYVLMTCGRSWPGGMESGRFNWLALPASPEAIADHLCRARNVDEGEAALVHAWGEDGPVPLPGRGGVDALVVMANDDWDETENLRRLACDADRIACLRFPDVGNHRDVVEELLRSPAAQELVLDGAYDEIGRFADVA